MTLASTPATLSSLRTQARNLLNEFDAADGLACYYALYHSPNRCTLFVHHSPDNAVDGFLVRCQTGIDLFRPLVTLRLRGQGALPDLIEEGLLPGRPYLLLVPAHLIERLKPHLILEQPSLNRILRLEPERFHPETNAMVVIGADPEGNPRAEVRRGGRPAAVAGVNWRSPIFAEIYVQTEEEQRERGWGRAAVNALLAELLRLDVTPLYSVTEKNDASLALAERVGFVDTGAREIMAHAMRADLD